MRNIKLIAQVFIFILAVLLMTEISLYAENPSVDYGNVPQNTVRGVAEIEPPFILELDAGGNAFRASQQVVINLDLTNVSSEAHITNIEFAFGITPVGEPANPVFSDSGTVDSLFSRGGKYTIYTAKVVLSAGDYDVWSIVGYTDQFGNYSNGWAKKRIVVTGRFLPADVKAGVAE